jgi:hypothetical protein
MEGSTMALWIRNPRADFVDAVIDAGGGPGRIEIGRQADLFFDMLGPRRRS